MATMIVFHEVDDVDHWLSSAKREEFFGPMGITARTFIDPEKTNRVGLIVEARPTATPSGGRWRARRRPMPCCTTGYVPRP